MDAGAASNFRYPRTSPPPRSASRAALCSAFLLSTGALARAAEPQDNGPAQALAGERDSVPRVHLMLACEVAELDADRALLVSTDRVAREHPVRLVFGRPTVARERPADRAAELAELKRSVHAHVLAVPLFDQRSSFALAAGWVARGSLERALGGRKLALGNEISVPLELHAPLAIQLWQIEPEKRFVELPPELGAEPAKLLQREHLERAIQVAVQREAEGILLCASTSFGTEAPDLYGRRAHTILDLLLPERASSDQSCSAVAEWAEGLAIDVEVVRAAAETIARFAAPEWPLRLRELLERAAPEGGETAPEVLAELLRWCAWSNDVELLSFLRPDAFTYGRATYAGNHDTGNLVHASRTPAFWQAARRAIPRECALLALLGGARRTLNVLTDDLVDPRASAAGAGARSSSLLHFAASLGERPLLEELIPLRFEGELRERRSFLESMEPIDNPLAAVWDFGTWTDLRPYWHLEALPSRRAIEGAKEKIAKRAQDLTSAWRDSPPSPGIGTRPARENAARFGEPPESELEEYRSMVKRLQMNRAPFDEASGSFVLDYQNPVTMDRDDSGSIAQKPRFDWSLDGRPARIPKSYGGAQEIAVVPLDVETLRAGVAASSTGLFPADHLVLLLGEASLDALMPAARKQSPGDTGGLSAVDRGLASLLERRIAGPSSTLRARLAAAPLPTRAITRSAEAWRELTQRIRAARLGPTACETLGGEARKQAIQRLGRRYASTEYSAAFDPRWKPFLAPPQSAERVPTAPATPESQERQRRRARR